VLDDWCIKIWNGPGDIHCITVTRLETFWLRQNFAAATRGRIAFERI
jgi:hypothetical protein